MISQEKLFPGQYVGPYCLLKELASGTFGTFFLADKEGEKVAMKVLASHRQLGTDLFRPQPKERPVFVGHFILGVLIPLPCPDPVAYVEQAMKLYVGEGNKTDGWELLEFQWDKQGDATPYAYISPDGSWNERAKNPYPEEKAYQQERNVVVKEHLAQFGRTGMRDLRTKIGALNDPVTDWHWEWHRVTHETIMCMVAFVWCHC